MQLELESLYKYLDLRVRDCRSLSGGKRSLSHSPSEKIASTATMAFLWFHSSPRPLRLTAPILGEGIKLYGQVAKEAKGTITGVGAKARSTADEFARLAEKAESMRERVKRETCEKATEAVGGKPQGSKETVKEGVQVEV